MTQEQRNAINDRRRENNRMRKRKPTSPQQAEKQKQNNRAVIAEATIFKENVVNLSPESNSFWVTTSDTANDVENSSNQHESRDNDVPVKSYRTIISMIAGSLVGNEYSDVHKEHTVQEESLNHQNELPTLSDAASS